MPITAPTIAAIAAVHVDATVRQVARPTWPRIRLPQATDAIIAMTVRNSDNTRTDITGASIVLTVRAAVGDDSPIVARIAAIIGATEGECVFTVTPADSDGLALGTYYYSVEVTWPLGFREQLARKTEFEIIPTVGIADDEQTESTIPPTPTVYAFLRTGQSLAVDYPATGSPDTEAIQGSWMLTGGIVQMHQVTPWPGLNTSALSQLVDQIQTLDGFATAGGGLHAMVKRLKQHDDFTNTDFIVASVGTQALGIASRDKTAGNAIYTNTLAVVQAMKDACEAAGLIFGGVLAIFEVGGESDAASAVYYDDLLQYQSDLSTDIRAIAPLSPNPIPMFLSQVVATAGAINPGDSSCHMTRAAHNFPARFAISVNKEILNDYTASNAHLLPSGYHKAGAYEGLAYLNWIETGRSLCPMPDLSTVTRSGQNYIVDWFAPTPPLVNDTDYVSQQVSPQLYGWSVYTSGFAERIVDAVTITDGPNGAGTRVTIHVTADPLANSYLRYAVGRGDDGRTTELPTSGPRGNLRDSSHFVDGDGDALPGNYAARFQIVVA